MSPRLEIASRIAERVTGNTDFPPGFDLAATASKIADFCTLLSDALLAEDAKTAKPDVSAKFNEVALLKQEIEDVGRIARSYREERDQALAENRGIRDALATVRRQYSEIVDASAKMGAGLGAEIRMRDETIDALNITIQKIRKGEMV